MVGHQVLGENELDKPINLAEKLLADSALEQALGGDILVLVGRERARSFDPPLVAPGGLWPTAVERLRALHSPPDAPAPLRARAGLTLGTDSDSIARLIELELQIEPSSGAAPAKLLVERDALLARMSGDGGT